MSVTPGCSPVFFIATLSVTTVYILELGPGLWNGPSVNYPESVGLFIAYRALQWYSLLSNYNGGLKDYVLRKF